MTNCLIFFDLETAGIIPKRHPIIQVAAIAVDAHVGVVEAFEAKLQFDAKKADKNALRKNHYHPGTWVREALPPKEAAREFSQFLRRHACLAMQSAKGNEYFVAQLVAHNAAFDGPFLKEWFEKEDLFLPASRQVLCTLQRTMWHFSEHPELDAPKDYKLATLCQYFGVPFHAAKAHEALADVAATVQLYQALLGHFHEKEARVA